MKREKYKSAAHAVYLCQYHLVWCPKSRFGILRGEVQEALKQIFYDIAKQYDYEIIEMEVMSDHVHLFVGSKLIRASELKCRFVYAGDGK